LEAHGGTWRPIEGLLEAYGGLLEAY